MMNMLKKWSALLLVSILLLSCLPNVAAAKSSGTSGDVTWSFKDGTLTFSGNGSTEDLTNYSVGDWYVHWQDIRTVVFAEGITRIGAYLLYDDTIYNSITSIQLPSTLTEIDEHAFTTLRGLDRVVISDLTAWCGVKMKGGSNPMDNGADLYLKGKKLTHLEIPQSVTTIPDYAFKGCRSIQKVTIHSKVKQIGSFAFNSCANLKEVYFEGSAPKAGKAVFTLSDPTVYVPKGDKTWTSAVKNKLNNSNKSVTWDTHTPTTTTEKPTTTTTTTTSKPVTKKTTVTTTEATTSTTEVTTTTTTQATSSQTTTTEAVTTKPTVGNDDVDANSPEAPADFSWLLWVAGIGLPVLLLLGWWILKRKS